MCGILLVVREFLTLESDNLYEETLVSSCVDKFLFNTIRLCFGGGCGGWNEWLIMLGWLF